MSGKTTIEWTEQSWNPIVGCSIVSPGCTNCYAMGMAYRFKASYLGRKVAGPPAENVARSVNGKAVWTGQLALAPDSGLLAPLKRKKPTTYFVNSMGDLFHEDCPDEWIDKVFAVMALSPHHTFQVLTKRAERMRDYCLTLGRHHEVDRVSIAMKAIHEAHGFGANGAFYTMGEPGWHFKNIWLGVSTERQQEADERIPLLLNTPAAVRFVSAEPLLGAVNLSRICLLPQKLGSIRAGIHLNALAGRYCESGVTYTGDWDVAGPAPPADTPARKLDWIIVGGESGHAARPMDPEWALALRDQCQSAGVPFFFKQWGAFVPEVRGRYRRVSKKEATRLLDGVEHNGFPEVRA